MHQPVACTGFVHNSGVTFLIAGGALVLILAGRSPVFPWFTWALGHLR